jgi:dTDP-4-dehydrorhamnose reductase
MSKEVLILGSQGTLGQALVKEFTDAGFNVTGWDRGDLDITTPEAGQKIKEFAPKILINATGYNAVDKAESLEEEKNMAFILNAEVPGKLAEICKHIGAIFVNFSTDYVFKGDKKEGYKEDDVPSPISVYGESKQEGEKLVTEKGEKYYIVRLSRLFGEKGISELSKRSFVDIMLAEIDKPELMVKNEEVGSLTYAPDLAKFIRELVESDVSWGIYHGANSGSCTWYGWAEEIFKIKGKGPKLIKGKASDYNNPAKRPAFSMLLNTKRPQQRGWKDALKEFLGEKS